MFTQLQEGYWGRRQDPMSDPEFRRQYEEQKAEFKKIYKKIVEEHFVPALNEMGFRKRKNSRNAYFKKNEELDYVTYVYFNIRKRDVANDNGTPLLISDVNIYLKSFDTKVWEEETKIDDKVFLFEDYAYVDIEADDIDPYNYNGAKPTMKSAVEKLIRKTESKIKERNYQQSMTDIDVPDVLLMPFEVKKDEIVPNVLMSYAEAGENYRKKFLEEIRKKFEKGLEEELKALLEEIQEGANKYLKKIGLEKVKAETSFEHRNTFINDAKDEKRYVRSIQLLLNFLDYSAKIDPICSDSYYDTYNSKRYNAKFYLRVTIMYNKEKLKSENAKTWAEAIQKAVSVIDTALEQRGGSIKDLSKDGLDDSYKDLMEF